MLADNVFERLARGRSSRTSRAQERGRAHRALARGRGRAPAPSRRRAHGRRPRRRRSSRSRDAPPSRYAVTGVYFYDAQVWESCRRSKPSGRGELEITDVNNWYVERGEMEADVVDGFWGDAGESIDAYYEVNDFVRRTRRQPVIEGLQRIPLDAARATSAAGSRELARASALPKPIRQANLSFSRKGVIRGLHFHERGQDDLFVCLSGHGARRRARSRAPARRSPRTSATTTRSRSTCPASTRTGTRRSPTRSSRTSSPRSTTRPTRTSTAIPWDDERVRHLWSTTSPILSSATRPS